MKNKKKRNIAGYIDHTLLKPDTTRSDLIKICKEAIEYNFYSVCIFPVFVEFIHNFLKFSDVKVCTVTGFPTGAHLTEVKVLEAKTALNNGADEIDMVIHTGSLIEGDNDLVFQDILKVADVCHENDGLLKVIIETAYLSDEEKIEAARLVCKAGADFVKTSTGFASSGASVYDVKMLKEAVKDYDVKVKAAGGIRTYQDAVKMIDAGAERIGTSSGVSIVRERVG